MALRLRHSVLTRAREVLLRNFSLSTAANSKVAVVFSGCGVYDGSEVHEASAILVHLSRQGATVGMFAPDVSQMHVVDHCKGEPVPGESRNTLVESARIARGNISALSSLSSSGYDAVVFPGGFGAAKNLSTFAVDGTEMKVNEDVQRVIQEFHQAGKPIGLCCISPVLGAKLLPGVTLTVGSDLDPAAQALVAMGAQHVAKSVTEALIDDQNKVVSTPAFMCDAPLHQVFDGIGRMITAVIKFIK